MGKIGTLFQHSGKAPEPSASGEPLDMARNLSLLNALTAACLPGYRWQACADDPGTQGPAAARLCPDGQGDLPQHLRLALGRAFAQGGVALDAAGAGDAAPQIGGAHLAALAQSAGSLRSEIAKDPDLNGMNRLAEAAAEGRRKRTAPAPAAL
ncbi:MAG: hypothetical protein HYU57_09670 [Micavibrio aeruginosavorus]|nr:hypothetical protein [Micavibrio aeruginosavorus]